jgi:hypothetical protein
MELARKGEGPRGIEDLKWTLTDDHRMWPCVSSDRLGGRALDLRR